MKFSVNTNALRDAVVNVQRAVSSKSSLSALEGILISTDGDSILLTGYDLEIAIKTTVEANVTEEGSVVVGAKLFGDIIRKADADIISVAVDDNLAINIVAGQSEFSIMGIEAVEYPELPSFEDKINFSISSEVLKSMVSQTIFSVSSVEGTKPVYTGILFEVRNNSIRLVAVDGHRLALRNEQIITDINENFIIPSKTLNEILKLIGEEDENVEIFADDRHISFKVGNYLLISRLIDGEFLDYNSVIHKDCSTTVICACSDMIRSVERMGLFISEKLKSAVRCTFDEGRAFIRCSTALGKASDFVDCDINGNPVEINFDNRYFTDALRASGCDRVRIEISSNPTAPIIIKPLEGDDFLFLILPIRLAAEQ